MKLETVINLEKSGLNPHEAVEMFVSENESPKKVLKFSYVQLSDPPTNIEYPKETDIVFDEPISKKLLIMYPITNVPVFSIRGNTRNELIKEIVSAYHKLYDIEEESSKFIASSMGFETSANTPGLIGIWGHSLRDLVLHTISIYNNCILIGVDS